MNKIEREYNESRAEREAGGADDMWQRGNTNRLEVPDSDDDDENEDDEDEEGEEGDEEEEEQEEDKDPFAISDDSDDEEEMAEIRRKILNSKSFQNPTSQPSSQPQQSSSSNTQPISASSKQIPIDSDSESGSAEASDEDEEAFDNIINATPVTDRTGILAAKKQRKANDSLTASFSRTVISAPKK